MCSSSSSGAPFSPMKTTITVILAISTIVLGLFHVYQLVPRGNHMPRYYEGKSMEMEIFLVETIQAMKAAVNSIDRRVDDVISSAKEELGRDMETEGKEVDFKLKSFTARSDYLKKFISESGTRGLLSKEGFGQFFQEFRKGNYINGIGGGEMTFDDIKKYAWQIVEKEIERHAADGLGRVDYAVEGVVMRHSKPYDTTDVGGFMGFWGRRIMSNVFTEQEKLVVWSDAKKIISPSFGEAGACFPLSGASGFVIIHLKRAIVPEAITLEHAAKGVVYDRSNAPNKCIISGWLQGQDLADLEGDTKKILLAEFSYDLNKSSAQTFDVVESASSLVINMVRLDFASNHGHASHTCIYRLRVHGHEPTYAEFNAFLGW